MANKICLYKIIAESESLEGINFKEKFEQEHPELRFRFCRFSCSGYQNYTGKQNGYCEQHRVIENVPAPCSTPEHPIA